MEVEGGLGRLNRVSRECLLAAVGWSWDQRFLPFSSLARILVLASGWELGWYHNVEI